MRRETRSSIRMLLISTVLFAITVQSLKCYRNMPLLVAPDTRYMWYFYFALLSVVPAVLALSRALQINGIVAAVLCLISIATVVYVSF